MPSWIMVISIGIYISNRSSWF